MPDTSGASATSAPCDPQARGIVRRQDRRGRPQTRRDNGRGREGAGASVARAMRRHPGRDRHRAGGRSASDLPPAGHGGALAGAGGAGPQLADIRHQPAGSFRARDAAVGDDLERIGGARRDEARGRRRAGDPRRHHDRRRRGSISRPCCMRWPRRASPGFWWKAARGWRHPLSQLTSSTKSGCCAVLKPSEATVSPRSTHCRYRLSPGRRRSSYVLAKACRRILLPSTSAHRRLGLISFSPPCCGAPPLLGG